MKKSDIFNSKQRTGKVRKMLASLIVVTLISTVAMAQEPYVFIEGSTHAFSVQPANDTHSLLWGMYTDPYHDIQMDPLSFTIVDNTLADVEVTFQDLSRVTAELVYLVVAETEPTNGCTTKRAIQIQLLPNNMYFDFAALPEANDCFNFDNNYFAEVQVGMNFMDRAGATDSAIPESRFPLKVKYAVENKTDGTGVIEGNGGEYLEIAYNADNAYFLEITEAKGEVDRTIEYELSITEVVDSYGTNITHDENRRVQIRIMKHLPQNGNMDMALAYVLTPINYMGAN